MRVKLACDDKIIEVNIKASHGLAGGEHRIVGEETGFFWLKFRKK